MTEVALAWVSKYSGENISSFEGLKTGVALCKAVNGIKADTIRNISTYNGAYKHMANIDNFLKVVEKVGISAEDRFKAEDLYYENNLEKVALTILLFADACSTKFGSDGVSTGGIDSLRESAQGSQKNNKTREKYTGLGIFDTNASKHQELASNEARQKDRLVKKDMQDHAASSQLSYLQNDQKEKQIMISKAKSSGQDLIIRSKEEATATAHLGVFGSDQREKQKMISKAKSSGQDLIIRSKEEATATAHLGVFGTDQQQKQKMISKAKSSGQDLIIRSREEAAVTGDLGLFGTDQVSKQKMISDAKGSGQDKIIKQKAEGEISFD